MFYDPRTDDHGLPHNPFMALVVPRPIGWISTRSAAGVNNLAPYSFFNAVSARPPYVMFASGQRKDSLANAVETGVFAVNIATLALRDAVNDSSVEVGPEVDEFAHLGLAKQECRSIPCPRVAEAPAVLECRLDQIVTLRPSVGTSTTEIAIGEVVGVDIADTLLTNGRVSVDKLQPLARMGYLDYAAITDVFEMARPAAPSNSQTDE